MPDSETPLSRPIKLSPQFLGREFVVSGLELWEWRKSAQAEAIAATIPPTEVDWLLQELTGLDRLALRLESFKERAEISLKLPFSDLKNRWQQRLQERIPLQYLTGITPWRQFCLKVNPSVLIPRPETEYLIDLAIAAADPAEVKGHWADLGTGSGAIALGLATAFPQATVQAVDWSSEALVIAQTNAETYHLTDRIQFHQGFWLQPLEHLKGRISGIVSNPPYIPTQMLSELQPEVTHHEPHLALDGGPDGLNSIRHLVTTAPDYLHPGGILLFEMMAGQAIAVTQLLHKQDSYRQIQIFPDLAGIDRFALAYRK
jgi:release factor glutamine methyltransferase